MGFTKHLKGGFTTPYYYLGTSLTAENIKVVDMLRDASPLDLETAHFHNVPGILVSNFDWCGIYEISLHRIEGGPEDENKDKEK